jgi:DNA-binding NtrC family response regulator
VKTMAPAALAAPVTPAAPMRVLLVDDEPGILRMFRTALENYGYVTEEASTVNDACARLTSGDFDAVVSDVNMPGGGGFELLTAMRARKLEVPVIIMTGKPPLDYAKLAHVAGAWRALIKPVMPTRLRETLEAVLTERGR